MTTDFAATMVDALDFMPYVVPQAPGVDPNEFIHALRRACDRFCALTWVWRDSTPAITVVQGINLYPLTMPDDAKLAKVIQVAYSGDDVDLPPCFLEAVTAGNADRLEREYKSRGCHWYMLPDARTLRLVATPLHSGTAIVTCAFRPTTTAMTFPQILLDDYADAIAAGTLANLKGVIGKPYSDMSGSAENNRLFLGYVGQAKIEAEQGFSRAVLDSAMAW